MRRLAVTLMALALIAAGCGDDDTTATTSDTAPTTTSVESEATTTSGAPTETSTTVATATSEPRQSSGPAFVMKGERSAYVHALQHYLDCAGFGPLAIDGVFGDGTATAVEHAQTAEGKEATGEPDEESFAALARACDLPRDVVFMPDTSFTEVAGHIVPGSEEVFILRAAAGQSMVVKTFGPISVAVQGADGTVLQRPDGTTEMLLTIPTSQQYELRVSASEATSYSVFVEIPPLADETTATTRPPADELWLMGDGLNVVDFGDEPEYVIETIADRFGSPAEDTGWEAIEDTPFRCGTVRRSVSWEFVGTEGSIGTTLELLFHDLWGPAAFRMWRYSSTYGFSEPEDFEREIGWLSTVHGISILTTYTYAVQQGYEIGGYEEPGDGSLDGVVISVNTEYWDPDPDAVVTNMRAGVPSCDIDV